MFFYIAGFLMSKLENMKIRYLSKKNSEAVNNRGGGNRGQGNTVKSTEYHNWKEFIYQWGIYRSITKFKNYDWRKLFNIL